jgi:signal transduction histidine kinase
MIHEFLGQNRAALIARCQSKVATRRAPRATEHELWYGIPLFLDQLIEALQPEQASTPSSSSHIAATATQHGNELLRRGFTVSEVVHDYGDLCQAVTEMAIEQDAAISVTEFRTLNRCLDDAIAGAVAEFERRRDELASDDRTRAANERLGFLAHELRNLIGTATIAVATIKKGRVGLTGATAALLDRSLSGLQYLVDRTLVDVRLTAGIVERRERIVVAELIADVQIAATIQAESRELELVVAPIDGGLVVEGDRQILAAALANVLQNAVKFTRPRGRISLTTHVVADRIAIAVEDTCGGLPEGKAEAMFRPFEQVGIERTGLGLGLPISRRGVEANGGTLRVRNLAGTGCVFTIELPRAAAIAPERKTTA